MYSFNFKISYLEPKKHEDLSCIFSGIRFKSEFPLESIESPPASL